MPEFKLPDVGEGLTEAEIVTWRVQVGDVIAINDVVVEIETAKSLVELPSPYAGTVGALLVPEGETVPVGTPIIRVGDTAGETASMGEIDLSNPAASGSGEGESLVGRMKAERSAVRRARTGGGGLPPGADATRRQVQSSFEPGLASPPAEEPLDLPNDIADEPAVPATSAVPVVSDGAADRVLAKPPVRKLAKDLGVDLRALTGTGPGGAVTREDVQSGAGSTPAPDSRPAAAEPPGPASREVREPIRGVRKLMASAMVDSAFSAPHVTEWVTVDVTATMELVDRLRTRREFADVKVSPLLVLARAATLAMRRTPEINSFWDQDAQEVVLKSYVNLGIAAATPRGLVVPNVKDADQLSLLELASALNELTATARDGRTQPAQMTGGTFTITNVGVFGIDAGTPIINPGESAILCFGAVRKQPWVVSTAEGDQIAVRQVTTLALSFDHRHIDGERGSRFLSDVAAILEDPATALLF